MDIQKDYSLSNFRINQDFSQNEMVKKQIIKVPVKKPDKSWFFRVHPDDKYRCTVYLFEISEAIGKELYLVDNSIAAEVYSEFPRHMKAQTIHTTITRQGDVFLWPIPQPASDGKDLDWYESARVAAKAATQEWTRIEANSSIGAYDVHHALAKLTEPKWPDEDFQSLLFKAFRYRIIDSLEHEALKKLRGML